MNEQDESLGEIWSRVHWLARALWWSLVAVVAVGLVVEVAAWVIRR